MAQRSPAAIEAALTASLPSLGCTLTRAIPASGSVAVTGVAGAGAPADSVRQASETAGGSRAAVQVLNFDGPYCPALDLLRALPDAAGASGMVLRQDGGPAPLLDNQVIALHATMPAFAGFLHVAYLQHDSTVSPLVPGPGYPSQTYAARASIPLGNPRQDSPGWQVGPPFGTDMIVAIASTAPLFSRPLPDSQPLATYLSSLQTAIDALRRRGGNVAATATVLETRPAR